MNQRLDFSVCCKNVGPKKRVYIGFCWIISWPGKTDGIHQANMAKIYLFPKNTEIESQDQDLG
jgi:hypothetical protein